jgi:lipoprotein Spr
MYKKNILLLILLLSTAFSQAQVITSKKEAVKKGVYEKPAEKATTSPSTTPAKSASIIAYSKPTAKKAISKPVTKSAKNKRYLINDKEDSDLVVGQVEDYLPMQMINNAMDFIGVNYRGGGTSKAGMDCSGMVTAVFNIFGKKLPRSSNEMAKVGEKLNPGEIKKGDLVFFRTNGRDTINHVGIVIEADSEEIKFIHSSTQKGVIISSTKEPYYKKTFAQANRVL